MIVDIVDWSDPPDEYDFRLDITDDDGCSEQFLVKASQLEEIGKAIYLAINKEAMHAEDT